MVELDDSDDELIFLPGEDEQSQENDGDSFDGTNNSSPSSTQSVEIIEPKTEVINILANKINKDGNLKRTPIMNRILL